MVFAAGPFNGRRENVLTDRKRKSIGLQRGYAPLLVFEEWMDLWYSLAEVTDLLTHFLPEARVDSIYDIDLAELKAKGIRGIITDLDNTLVGAKDKLATPALVNWLERVKAEGFQIVVVSNNTRARVSAFAEPLRLGFIYSARKPRSKAFKRALEIMNLQPREAVVVGDQLLTDMFGGNRLGIHTILVRPVSIGDENIFTRFNRRIEKWVISRLKRKGIIPWEDYER
jgi:HAD superfamily (subfamily IIIA) phosphatase, TIGR01668